ncbi:MAG: prepilin peptidase [Lachnospiraceae bacterium]
MKYIFMTIFLMWAAMVDARTGKIPNEITVSGWVIAILCGILSKEAWWNNMLASVVLSVPFLIFHHKAMIGGGDVKIIAMLGAYVGIMEGLTILFVSFILAGVYGVCRWRKEGIRKAKVYYAPFLFAAGILWLCVQ